MAKLLDYERIIESNPNIDEPAFQCFTKYVNVLDCFSIYAESSITNEKVLHAAAVAAELLDNNEDGLVDEKRDNDAGSLIGPYDGIDNLEFQNHPKYNPQFYYIYI